MVSRQQDIVESTLGSPESVNLTKLEILKVLQEILKDESTQKRVNAKPIGDSV